MIELRQEMDIIFVFLTFLPCAMGLLLWDGPLVNWESM
jgi:hypothetical protein